VETRRLMIVSTEPLRSGTGRRGGKWTLSKVRATTPDGAQITEQLVTFESLPVGAVVELEVKRRHDERFGDSFTLSKPRSGGGMRGRVEALERALEGVELRLAALEGVELRLAALEGSE
jgi:hypothetical protein